MADPEPTPTPEPNPTPDPTPDPTPEPKPKPDPAPEPDPTPDPTPDPEPKPEETWRTKMAGGDEKFLKQLDRYGAEADFGKAHNELIKANRELQKNAKPTTLDKNATDAEKAVWRENNDVPATSEEYKIELPDGLVIGEAEKPGVDAFVKGMHDINASNETVNSALGVYFAQQDAAQLQQKVFEKEMVDEAHTELKTVYGPEFTANQAILKGWLEKQPEVVRDALMRKDDDGNPQHINAEFSQWLINHIRSTDPLATVAGGIESSGTSVQEEIEKIQLVIEKTPEKYDKKMQARMIELANIKVNMAAAA